MPVARNPFCGSPTTPAESCANAVARAGLRQPRRPANSATSRPRQTRPRAPETGRGGKPRQRGAPRPRRQVVGLRMRRLPVTLSPARPARRQTLPCRHVVDAHDLHRLGLEHRRDPRQPGEPAQHRGAAIDRRRQHQARPQDHPVEVGRRQIASASALVRRTRSGRRADAPIAEIWTTRRTPARSQAANSAQVAAT